MKKTRRIAGISLLVLMLLTYISFFSGLSFLVIKLNITPKKSLNFIKKIFKTKDLNQSEEIFKPETIDNEFIDNYNEEISIEIQDEIPETKSETKYETSNKFFDPKLDLSNYKHPSLDLLKDEEQPIAKGKLYTSKDFDSMACEKLYENFKTGMIEEYLQRKALIRLPYIVSNEVLRD